MDPQKENEYRVTPLELFFDLVFVFAVSQLSQHLIGDFSWRGAAETVVLLVTVLTVWSYTSWAATMIPIHRPASAGMVLTVMALGLLMNASIGKAFVGVAWGFVAPLLLIEVGRTIWTIVFAPDTRYRKHYIQVLVWFVATAPLWVVGALLDAHSRLLCWAAATTIELVGTWLAHPVPGRRLHSERMSFNAEHMLERCSLFLIIALGETVLTLGTSIAVAPTAPMTLLIGGFGLVEAVALWALAFGSAHRHTLRQIEHSSDPVRVSRHAVNTLIMMVAGLIAVAVANEAIIGRSTEKMSLMLGLMTAGGPVLFLIAQSWYVRKVLTIRAHLHWIGAGVVALCSLTIPVLPPYGVLIVIGSVLAVLAVYDWIKVDPQLTLPVLSRQRR